MSITINYNIFQKGSIIEIPVYTLGGWVFTIQCICYICFINGNNLPIDNLHLFPCVLFIHTTSCGQLN